MRAVQYDSRQLPPWDYRDLWEDTVLPVLIVAAFLVLAIYTVTTLVVAIATTNEGPVSLGNAWHVPLPLVHHWISVS